MYLGWTGWVYPRYFVHFLVMYLQCTSLVNWPFPPVSTLIKQEVSRMTDLSLSLEDLLENTGNHVGRHTKTLLDGKCLTLSQSTHLCVNKTFKNHLVQDFVINLGTV